MLEVAKFIALKNSNMHYDSVFEVPENILILKTINGI